MQSIIPRRVRESAETTNRRAAQDFLNTGHRTRSVFDRYHIVAPEDLKAAAARMAARDSHKVSHSPRGVRKMVTRNSR